MGGRLLLTRGNKGAFSERDRILPLFCSVGGGNDQNTTININRVLFLSAMMYCRENKHILHKHYTEIAKEMMHEGDHHFIAKHKALLPTFEDEDDDNSESKIDVGVD